MAASFSSVLGSAPTTTVNVDVDFPLAPETRTLSSNTLMVIGALVGLVVVVTCLMLIRVALYCIEFRRQRHARARADGQPPHVNSTVPDGDTVELGDRSKRREEAS
jgi:hypothetical protein